MADLGGGAPGPCPPPLLFEKKKKKCVGSPPRSSAFWGLARLLRLAAVRKVCCAPPPPFFKSWIRPCPQESLVYPYVHGCMQPPQARRHSLLDLEVGGQPAPATMHPRCNRIGIIHTTNYVPGTTNYIVYTCMSTILIWLYECNMYHNSAEAGPKPGWKRRRAGHRVEILCP